MSHQRWAFRLAYDGSDFSGWQIQPDVRTVQGELQRALEQRFQQKIMTMGQGRTDAGVHAAAQIAHADLPVGFDSIQKGEGSSRVALMRGIQSFLPADIRLLNMWPVANDFHARFDAIRRQYRYVVFWGGSPLLDRVGWRCSNPLDIGLLQTMASRVVGTHDFVRFCIPPSRTDATTICTVHVSEWKEVMLDVEGDFFPVFRQQEGDVNQGVLRRKGHMRLENLQGNEEAGNGPRMWIYTIEADRFMHHMVRRLVGTMVRLAQKDIVNVMSSIKGDSSKKRPEEKKIQDWDSMLQADRNEKNDPEAKKGFTAPAQGLMLMDVQYTR